MCFNALPKEYFEVVENIQGSLSHSDRYLKNGKVQRVLGVAGLGYRWGKGPKLMSVSARESGEVAKI